MKIRPKEFPPTRNIAVRKPWLVSCFSDWTKCRSSLRSSQSPARGVARGVLGCPWSPLGNEKNNNKANQLSREKLVTLFGFVSLVIYNWPPYKTIDFENWHSAYCTATYDTGLLVIFFIRDPPPLQCEKTWPPPDLKSSSVLPSSVEGVRTRCGVMRLRWSGSVSIINDHRSVIFLSEKFVKRPMPGPAWTSFRFFQTSFKI